MSTPGGAKREMQRQVSFGSSDAAAARAGAEERRQVSFTGGTDAVGWRPPEREAGKSAIRLRAQPPPNAADSFTRRRGSAPTLGAGASSVLARSGTQSNMLKRRATISLGMITGGGSPQQPQQKEVFNETFANNGGKVASRRMSCRISSGVNKHSSRFLHSQGTVSSIMMDTAVSFKGGLRFVPPPLSYAPRSCPALPRAAPHCLTQSLLCAAPLVPHCRVL